MTPVETIPLWAGLPAAVILWTVAIAGWVREHRKARR